MAKQIMIKYRHGGTLDFGSNVAYIGGSVDVEFCDAEDISLEQLKMSVTEYGYNNVGMLYYSIPSVGLASGGLKPLNSDQDLAEMIEHALRHRVIEIYANHDVDMPLEVIEGPTSVATSPKRNIPMVRRKKLTPKKRVDVKEGQVSVSNPTISPLWVPSKSPLPSPSNSPPHKSAQTSSSDDDDDSVEDENSRVDPTEPLYDDDGEDKELF
ncbi:uncharacterized protein LOC109827595 [Asparagus officinalis]|uniref:uncharacterized protein LOC109827595 n=1 Tax=Asparagus officinalis TaxID=4686 RepID=UPI00098E10C3|nr:uncharacterized protein LOC109827595 [Asparagus officinalis]